VLNYLSEAKLILDQFANESLFTSGKNANFHSTASIMQSW